MKEGGSYYKGVCKETSGMKWVKKNKTLPPASWNCHIFQLFFYEIQISIAAPVKSNNQNLQVKN